MGGSSVAYFAGCGCGDSTSGSCGRGVSCGGCDGQCGVHSAALPPSSAPPLVEYDVAHACEVDGRARAAHLGVWDRGACSRAGGVHKSKN